MRVFQKKGRDSKLALALLSPLRWLSLQVSGSGPSLSFKRVEIDPSPPQNPWIKIAGDVNGDGRTDVIIGGSKGPLVWYLNPGWTKTVIAEAGYDSVDGETGDVDGDGDLDIIVGGVLWYENPRPQGDPAKGPWLAHRIGNHRSHDVEVGDLDKDGKLDVVVRGQTGFGHKEGHRILIWRQDSPAHWTSRELACPEGEGLKLADLDGDKDLDIIIGTRWYENPGAIHSGTWAEHIYTQSWKWSDCKVAMGDFNQDGRLDIVLTPAEEKGGTYRIAWYEAPPDRTKDRWKEHLVEESVETVMHALGVADMNRDGQPDVVTAQMHQRKSPQELCVYVNDRGGRQWSKQVVSPRGSHNIVLVELGKDGAIDILGANHGGPFQPVEWWKNQKPGH